MLLSRSFGAYRMQTCRKAFYQSCVARFSSSRQILKSDSPEKSEGDNKPYPFMSKYSQQKYNTAEAFQAQDSETWEYQPFVFLGCVCVFLLYFLVLREENEVDDSIAEAMYAMMPELEVQDVKRKIQRYKKHGLYTQHLEDRLDKLQR